MWHWIDSLDQDMVVALGCQGRLRWLNSLLVLWRNQFLWLPLYIGFIAWVLERYGNRLGFKLLGTVVLVAGAADFLSAGIIKPMFQRLRPCNNDAMPDCFESLVGCGSGFSFISAHATNHMALGVLCFLLFGHLMGVWRWLLIAWALSIGFGQVYVGVHYPSDVLAGFSVGAVLGWLGYRLFIWFFSPLED
jgi:membrane-associated phospholipid phosphatase